MTVYGVENLLSINSSEWCLEPQKTIEERPWYDKESRETIICKKLQLNAFKESDETNTFKTSYKNNCSHAGWNNHCLNWSGKFYWHEKTFVPISEKPSDIEEHIGKSAIVTYNGYSLYRLFSACEFETHVVQLSRQPLKSGYITINGRKKQCCDFNINAPLCVMYGDTESHKIEIRDENRLQKTLGETDLDYHIINYRTVPERVLHHLSDTRDAKLKGVMGILAVSTSIGDIYPTRELMGIQRFKSRNRNIPSITRAEKGPLYSVFDYDKMKVGEDPRDIYVVTYNSHEKTEKEGFVKWEFLSRAQKDEFLEVKRRHLKIIDYIGSKKHLLFRIFYKRFEESEKKCLTKATAEHYMDMFIEHIKKQGEIYAKDLEEYEKRREEIFKDQGDEEYNCGDFARARIYYEKNLNLNLGKYGKDHYETGNSLNLVGKAEFPQKKIDCRAKRCFSEELSILEKTLPENHPYIARPLNNRVLFKGKYGEYAKSEEYYKRALEILQKIFPEENSILFAITHHNLSNVYYQKELWGKCLELAKKSYKIFKELLPEDDEAIATICYNLGMVYSKLKRYEEATKVYKINLKILSKTCYTERTAYEKYSLDIALAHKKLGDVYFERDKYHKSQAHYHKALQFDPRFSPCSLTTFLLEVCRGKAISDFELQKDRERKIDSVLAFEKKCFQESSHIESPEMRAKKVAQKVYDFCHENKIYFKEWTSLKYQVKVYSEIEELCLKAYKSIDKSFIEKEDLIVNLDQTHLGGPLSDLQTIKPDQKISYTKGSEQELSDLLREREILKLEIMEDLCEKFEDFEISKEEVLLKKKKLILDSDQADSDDDPLFLDGPLFPELYTIKADQRISYTKGSEQELSDLIKTVEIVKKHIEVLKQERWSYCRLNHLNPHVYKNITDDRGEYERAAAIFDEQMKLQAAKQKKCIVQ